jgi:hypothetical protein
MPLTWDSFLLPVMDRLWGTETRIRGLTRHPKLGLDGRPPRRDRITLLSFSPHNVQETGVSPVDGLDPAWWPRRRSSSSELKKDLVTGPI